MLIRKRFRAAVLRTKEGKMKGDDEKTGSGLS